MSAIVLTTGLTIAAIRQKRAKSDTTRRLLTEVYSVLTNDSIKRGAWLARLDEKQVYWLCAMILQNASPRPM